MGQTGEFSASSQLVRQVARMFIYDFILFIMSIPVKWFSIEL